MCFACRVLSLTYVSSASELLSVPDLVDLLAEIRPKNEANDITGLLLYSGGNIIQALEGPEATVDATFEAITGDSRHHGVMVLVREPIERRLFPDWSMGFRNLGDLDAGEIEGFNDFLQHPAAATLADRAEPAYRMLSLFRETMR